MTQPPFSGNDFFDQIDSVARNLTGNAFRLKKNDPTAPQKFTEFVAQSEQEFSATQPQAAPQSFRDFEQGGFVSPEVAEARLQDPDWVASQTQPTFAGNEGAPGPLGIAGTALQGLGEWGFGNLAAILPERLPEIKGRMPTGRTYENPLSPPEFREALERERAFIRSKEATNPLARTLQEIEARTFAPATAERQTKGDFPQFPVTQGMVDNLGNVLSSANPILGTGLDVVTPDPVDREAVQFTLGAAELGEALFDPLNVVPVLGSPRLVTKPLSAGSRVVTGAGKKALSAADEAAAAVGRTGVGNVLDTVPPQTVAGRAAGGAGDGGRTQLGFIQDNPLKKLQDEGVTEGRQFDNAQASVVGNKRIVTGSYDNIDVPVEALKGLPGSRGEESLTGLPLEEALRSRAEIVKSIRERGFDPSQRPLIGVEPNGTVNVIEGNQRIAAAAEAGLETIPVEVKYFGGSEMLPDVFDPANIPGSRLSTPTTPPTGTTAARGAGKPKFAFEGEEDLVLLHGTDAEFTGIPNAGKDGRIYFSDSTIEGRGASSYYGDTVKKFNLSEDARMMDRDEVLTPDQVKNIIAGAEDGMRRLGLPESQITSYKRQLNNSVDENGSAIAGELSDRLDGVDRGINPKMGEPGYDFRGGQSKSDIANAGLSREFDFISPSGNRPHEYSVLNKDVIIDSGLRQTNLEPVGIRKGPDPDFNQFGEPYPTTPATGTAAARQVPDGVVDDFANSLSERGSLAHLDYIAKNITPDAGTISEWQRSSASFRQHLLSLSDDGETVVAYRSSPDTAKKGLESWTLDRSTAQGFSNLHSKGQLPVREARILIDDVVAPGAAMDSELIVRSSKAAPIAKQADTASKLTPQQQAIIDDVGTGALPANDLAVDAAAAIRAADDASLRAIEDATPLGESARDARAAETTYTPESMTVGDDARRVFGADQTIDFKLTTKERATNRLREVLPPDSSKPGSTLGPDADPIVDRLWEEHTKINQRAINLGRTISARVTPRIKKVFKLDDNDRIPSLAGIDPEIPNAPTIQDVAARLPRYFDSMTPEQQQLIRELEVQFKPFGDALRASGDEFGTRLDIIEGGFYIPRGGAENGDQAIRLRGRGGRGTKPSSERTATFLSMAKALDDGWEYDRLGDAINGYVASAGRRVADNFFTDAMKGVRNEAGERLGLTAKEVLVRDNPAVAARFAALTKASTKLKNLLKSKDSQLFKNLERLLADPEFDDIEAVRKAFSNSRTVLRGELKGKNIAEVRKALTDLQKELRTFKPEYEAAKKRILAGRAGGDEKRIGLSLFPQLDGITFPERMAARAEELINSTDLRAFADKKLRYADDINRVYKSINATADNSAIGIQMLPAIYDNPWRQRRSVIASLMAWAHPDTYSDAVTQFNKRATNSGRVTSDDWAGKYGLAQVSGDANAQDVTSGLLEKGLGIPVVKKPLGSFFKRADAAFNTGGDMARLEMADDMLSEELARGRTLKELHSSGDMRRIANEASAATGYVEGKFAVENLIMFSARFFQARLLTLLRAARGLDIDAPLDLLPVVGNKLRQTGKVPTINRYSRIQDRYARRMILRTLGWGTMLTVLLNEIQGQSTDFNLMKDGKYNSNFIRFRAFGKDRSMFGPLDTMLRIFVNLSTGQAKQTAETFAQSPLASSFLDLFENKDFTGAPIFDPKGTKLEQALQILEYQATQTVPFALGEAADSIGRIIEGAKNSNPIKVGIGTLDFLSDHIGLKSSPLSSAELRELLTITSDPAIRADIQRELDERKARFRRFDKPRRISGDPDPAFN